MSLVYWQKEAIILSPFLPNIYITLNGLQGNDEQMVSVLEVFGISCYWTSNFIVITQIYAFQNYAQCLFRQRFFYQNGQNMIWYVLGEQIILPLKAFANYTTQWLYAMTLCLTSSRVRADTPCYTSRTLNPRTCTLYFLPYRMSDWGPRPLVKIRHSQILTTGPTSQSCNRKTCAHGDVSHATSRVVCAGLLDCNHFSGHSLHNSWEYM